MRKAAEAVRAAAITIVTAVLAAGPALGQEQRLDRVRTVRGYQLRHCSYFVNQAVPDRMTLANRITGAGVHETQVQRVRNL